MQIGLAAGSASSSHAPAGAPIRKPTPPPAQLAWQPSEASARLRAKNRGLPLVIYVRADWDAASIGMDREVFSHPTVLAHAASFVAFKLDVTAAEGDAELAAARHGIQALPTTIVCDAYGKEVVRLTGLIDPQALLMAIKKAGGT